MGPDNSQETTLRQDGAEACYAPPMIRTLAAILVCLSLAACGNCRLSGNNDRTSGGCSILNTGF
jgi:hypothetical protein